MNNINTQEDNQEQINILCDFNLFFSDLKRWSINKQEQLSEFENDTLLNKLVTDIENNTYTNEFLFSSIDLYIYTLFGVIQKDEDGYNYVRIELLVENLDRPVIKEYYELVCVTLIAQYDYIFKKLNKEKEFVDFKLDAYNFNQTVGANNILKFSHHKGIKEFDNLTKIHTFSNIK